MNDTNIPTPSDAQPQEDSKPVEASVSQVKEPQKVQDAPQADAPAPKPEKPIDKPDIDAPIHPNEEKAKWYVIHTYSGHENKVAATLTQRIDTQKLSHKIFKIIVPTRNIVTVKHGKKEEVKEKIFPGYILVKMLLDDETWLAVRTTQGVTAFVGVGNKPTPISEKEVSTILKFMEMDAPKYKTTFSVQEAVKIIDGPFADFLGTINSIDEEKGKVKVLVSIFGRETPVELDFLQIAKL